MPASKMTGLGRPTRLTGRCRQLAFRAALSGTLAGCADGPNAPLSESAALTRNQASDKVETLPASDQDFSLAGTLPLPVNQTFSGAQNQTALAIKSTGSGGSGSFRIVNPSNAMPALEGKTNGSGVALLASNTGSGLAGWFQILNSASTAVALRVDSDAQSASIRSDNTGTGSAAELFVLNAANGSNALSAVTKGTGDAGRFWVNNSASGGDAIDALNSGMGWAGRFSNNGRGGGVLVTTSGGPGLQVIGGSKNAVVATSGGARALYTEESTEVWFTDYGFGRLRNGSAHITLDPTFAETVALGEPYHVFVQSYGSAELYVARRTETGFEVVRRGGDASAEFSYRVVAKRRGFERARLERAPWADGSVRLQR